MNQFQEKGKTHIQKISHQEYGIFSSHPTSTSLRLKRIQRKRQPHENRSRSKEHRLVNTEKSPQTSPYESRFINNKDESINQTNDKTTSKDQQIYTRNSEIRRFQRKRGYSTQSYQQRRIYSSLNQNKFGRGRIENQKQELREVQLCKQITKLQNVIYQINQQLENKNNITKNQKEIIKVLEIKIANFSEIFQEKQKFIIEKTKQIQKLRQNIEALEKQIKIHQVSRQLNQDKRKSEESLFLESSQKINLENFPTHEKHSAFIDISLEIDYSKLISGLNEKIKYQDIQIQMLKRSKQELKQHCFLRDKEIKMLNFRIKNILKNTPKVDERNMKKKHPDYEPEEQDITLQISID